MKKLLLVTVMTFFGLANLFAQEVEFGVKGGLNFASISGDNTGDIDPVTSFNFGVMSEIPISEKFSFQPELMYSGQGYSIGDDTVELSYLNLPLMGKYYVTKGLSLEVGPQIGFLLAADNEGTDVKDSFNSVDLGVNFGVSYKLDNGLYFGLRYTLGLSDINDLDGFNDKNQNGVFQFSVGYFF